MAGRAMNPARRRLTRRTNSGHFQGYSHAPCMQCLQWLAARRASWHNRGRLFFNGEESYDSASGDDLNVKDELERLRVLSDDALLAFLRADLDLGFTLIATARTERELADPAGAEQAKQKALSVAHTVQRFKARLPLEAQPEIEKRLSDLENLIRILNRKK